MKRHTNFRFKQFEIQHEFSAMKVGTDGVLLGAWAGKKVPNNILDIGTGTGLIALMLAQRFPIANVIGVEHNALACSDAHGNFRKSPFSSRLNLVQSKIQDFTSDTKFDLIVSNPPFFENALESSNQDRNSARHSVDLNFKDLIESVSQFLNHDGQFATVLPKIRENELLNLATNHGLFVTDATNIRGREDSEIKRVLLSFSKNKDALHKSELTIEKSRHVYTDDYIQLTKDFYLKM